VTEKLLTITNQLLLGKVIVPFAASVVSMCRFIPALSDR
jgi:hypothetical protein